jgi:hypothetical protein
MVSGMTAAICNPDTIHAAFYIAWNVEIVKDLLSIKYHNDRTRPSYIRVREYIDRRAILDPDCDLHQMTYPEVLKLANELVEKEKSEAKRQTSVESHWEFASRTWVVTPFSGKKGCDLTLRSGDLLLHVRLGKPSDKLANVHVELGSVALWTKPWRELIRDANSVICTMGREIRPHNISRLDVAYHCQGIGDLSYDRFVTKLRKKAEIEKKRFFNELEIAIEQGKMNEFRETYQDLQGVRKRYLRGFDVETLEFGSRSRLFARIYRKDSEIRFTPEKKAVFPKIWQKAGFDLDEPIYNVEFQLMRTFFRERELQAVDDNGVVTHIAIDTFADLEMHWDVLLVFLVGNENQKGYLRLTKGENINIRQRPVHDAWKALWNTVQPLEFVKQYVRSGTTVYAKSKEIAKRSSKAIAHLLRNAQRRIFVPSNLWEAELTEDFCRRLLMQQIDEYNHLARADSLPLFHELVMHEATNLGVCTADTVQDDFTAEAG